MWETFSTKKPSSEHAHFSNLWRNPAHYFSLFQILLDWIFWYLLIVDKYFYFDSIVCYHTGVWKIMNKKDVDRWMR